MPGHYSTNNNKSSLTYHLCARFSSQNNYLHWLAVLNFNITPFVIRIFYIVSNRQNQLCETKKEIPNTFYSLGLLHHLFKSLSQLIVVTCYFY